ncbi:phage tail protein [Aeromonas caviae]|uniref:phage tail-collar fiber domain-containing protein n=1 Tax=Aeromonas caviae TaxID=648 RepID=UPI002541BDCB|nr:phage tail protein [Aeromonas caviae]MDK3164196.1 phage tail protein [Aeromonas caviae]
MSQVITNAFEQYWQSCLTTEQPVVMDEFILADIPNLDIISPIDPETGLPPESQIVHRQNVDQRGRINNNAVACTIVMDTTVGDFSFNAMYLRNKQNGVIGMIVYKGRETKLKTDQTTGQTGNSLVKSMLMGYDQAAEATLTNVDAGTWQIDYAARLRGMDEDIRQLQADLYGHHTFVGDGFKVVEQDGAYQVSQGVAIIGGLRVELKAPEVIHPGTKPIGVWVDVHRAGSLLSEHQNHFTIITSVADLADHVDSNGYQHYVAKLANVLADGTIEDGRGSAGGGSGGAGSIPHTFALWKRSMAEAGYDLIGQFGTEMTIETDDQVVLSRDGKEVYLWTGPLPKHVDESELLQTAGYIETGVWKRITDESLRSKIQAFSGSLIAVPGNTDVPKHSDEVLGEALNAQAQALLNRQEQLKRDLSGSNGVNFVGNAADRRGEAFTGSISAPGIKSNSHYGEVIIGDNPIGSVGSDWPSQVGLRDAINISRKIQNEPTDCHAVADKTIIDTPNDYGGYGAFDATTILRGPHTHNHIAAFQSRISYQGSGILENLWGHIIWPTAPGSGKILDNVGIQIKGVETTTAIVQRNRGIDIDPKNTMEENIGVLVRNGFCEKVPPVSFNSQQGGNGYSLYAPSLGVLYNRGCTYIGDFGEAGSDPSKLNSCSE